MRRLLLLLLAVACEGSDGAPRGDRPPPLVRVGVVEAGTLTERWPALGDVRPLQSADLAAGAAGPVASVQAREGDRVSAGAVLLDIDRAAAAARLAAARAAAREASIEHERLGAALARREAVTTGVLSREELVDARARVAAQAARLAGLEAAADESAATLARHRVRAPFDGVVTARAVDPGDWVTIGQPVLTLVSIDALEVHVRVPRRVAQALSPGATARLATGGAATVAAIVPAVDPDTRTVLVRLTPGPGSRLAAGEAVDVDLPVAWSGEGVKVPRDALLLQPGSARVLRLDGEVAVSVEVEVLATADTDALVVGAGLAAGDRVITRGNERARPGQPVRVEAPAESP